MGLSKEVKVIKGLMIAEAIPSPPSSVFSCPVDL